MCYTCWVRFEWDPAKAAANASKHGITFEEAAECFTDPMALVLDEPRHTDRLILIGVSTRTKVIFTVYVHRTPAVIRIISARRATRREQVAYEQGDE